MLLDDVQGRTWAEIDLDALSYNYNSIKKELGERVRVCCVVKADAYGHGAERVAALYESLGADYLAVSNLHEALSIRAAGVSTPILVLGYTRPSCAQILYDNSITQCVYSYEYGTALATEAERCGVRLKVHFKIDVGMGRIGFIIRDGENDALDGLLALCKRPAFITEGIFTHFPMAGEGDRDRGITQTHFERFCSICDALEEKGASFAIKHCANSAAALKYPQCRLDMVRMGIALYGVSPAQDIDTVPLKSTIAIKTVVANVKSVLKGETVGYGCEYIAERDVVVATLPIGYADGFRCENFRNGTQLRIGGVMCDIVGRVCMDQIMVDVTDVAHIALGDEVVIYGADSGISVEELARRNQTIPYEIMCAVSSRVPRVYVSEGNVESVRDSFV